MDGLKKVHTDQGEFIKKTYTKIKLLQILLN